MRSSMRLWSRLSPLLRTSPISSASTSTSTSTSTSASASIATSPRARMVAVTTGVTLVGTAAFMSTNVNAAPSPASSTSLFATSLPTLTPIEAATRSFSASPPVTETNVRLGLCQVHTRDDKQSNLKNAADAVSRAAAGGAKIVVLPEMFNCPYSNDSFPKYAEEIAFSTISVAQGKQWIPNAQTHPSSAAISSWAKQHGVWIVAGSIPEKEIKTGRIFNTAIVVNPQGQFVAKHRKVHLFDIDVPGRMTFRESDTLSPGNEVTLFDTPYGRIGLGICYDLRFAEYAQLATQNGASILIYPGAFNMTTGPLHWELLLRARAVDNQVFVAACSPARDTTASYHAWGHSSVISPWGDVVATTGEQATIVFADVDLTRITQMRQNIPVRQQKRHDLYRVINMQDSSSTRK